MTWLGLAILLCVLACFVLACLDHILPPTPAREAIDWWDQGPKPPSRIPPAGADAPGDAGERDGERHPSSFLPDVAPTAGGGGPPRDFSERVG